MRAQLIEISCDLCGITSSQVGPEVFETLKGSDLCRWCRSTASAWIESGGHRVSLNEAESSWRCSCDRTYEAELAMRAFTFAPGARYAVPSLPMALAHIHLHNSWRS